MKKLIAINGSPRKNWNTAQLLQNAAKGAEGQAENSSRIQHRSIQRLFKI